MEKKHIYIVILAVAAISVGAYFYFKNKPPADPTDNKNDDTNGPVNKTETLELGLSNAASAFSQNIL